MERSHCFRCIRRGGMGLYSDGLFCWELQWGQDMAVTSMLGGSHAKPLPVAIRMYIVRFPREVIQAAPEWEESSEGVKKREREAHYLSCPPRLPLAAQIAQNFILEFPFYCSMTMTRGSHFLFQDQTCMLFHWALGNSYTCKMLLNVCAGWLLCTPRGWGAI